MADKVPEPLDCFRGRARNGSEGSRDFSRRYFLTSNAIIAALAVLPSNALGRPEERIEGNAPAAAGRIPLFIAHRGFSSKYPENSVEAFEAAIAAGADVIEMDVRLSRDGVAVLNHDASLERLHGRSQNIDEVDEKELASIGIVRLATVLSTVRGRVKVMLDFKLTTEAGMAPGFKIVDDLGMGGDVIAGVQAVDQVPVIRRLCPKAALIALPMEPPLLPAFYAAGCKIGRLWEDNATRAGIAAAKASGMSVWVTTGPPREGEAGMIDAPRLRRLFADGVIVNDVANANAVRATLPPS